MPGEPTPDPAKAAPVVPDNTPVVEPVVEPAVTPVAPVEPAVKVEPAAEPVTPVAEPIVEPVKEIPQGDFLTSADTILTDAGFDTSDVVEKINANNGEVSVELYNDIVGKTSKGVADSLVSGFKTEVANAETRQQAETAKVYEEVGGEEVWNKIAEWTADPASKLDPAAAKQYNAMLAAGGVQAQLAAKALKEAYMASPGFSADANLVPGDSTPAPSGLEPISRVEYTKLKKEARQKGDGVADAALDARARHTMENLPNQWRLAPLEG